MHKHSQQHIPKQAMPTLHLLTFSCQFFPKYSEVRIFLKTSVYVPLLETENKGYKQLGLKQCLRRNPEHIWKSDESCNNQFYIQSGWGVRGDHGHKNTHMHHPRKVKRFQRNTVISNSIYTVVKHQGRVAKQGLFPHTLFSLCWVPTVLTILSQIFPEPPQGQLPPQIHRVLGHGPRVKQKLYDDFHLPPSKRK